MRQTARLDRIWSAVLEYRWAMLVAFCAAILVYGPDLFHFSLTVDEEIYLYYNSRPVNFLDVNRWGMFLLKEFLLPAKFSPFFSTLLAVLLLCCAAAVTSASLKLTARERAFFCTLYVIFPQFAYQVYFAHQIDCLAFGVLCAATAFYAFLRFADTGRWSFLVLSVGTCAFAAGVYQSLLFLPPVLYMADMLRRLLEREPFSAQAEIRRFFLFLGIMIGALYLNFLLTRFFLKLFTFPVSGYLLGHVGWLSRPFRAVLATSFAEIIDHLTGQAYYGEALFLGAYAFAAVIVLSHWRALSASGKRWLVIILPGFLLAPFLQILCFGSPLPPRTLLGQSPAFAVLGTFALFRPARHKLLVTLVAAFCVLAAAAHTSQLFFANALSWQADRLLATRIIERIQSVDPEFPASGTKIYIYGAPDMKLPRPRRADTFGSSFFIHDGGNTYRTRVFMSLSGLGPLRIPTREEALQLHDKIKDMPLWPHRDSVTAIDGVVVVKLGPEPGFIGPAPDFVEREVRK